MVFFVKKKFDGPAVSHVIANISFDETTFHNTLLSKGNAMLVLSRKKNETIVIDGGIEVEILQTKGGTVKVGIKAPSDVRIVRGELEMYPQMIPAGNDAANESSEIEAVADQPRLNIGENELDALPAFTSELDCEDSHLKIANEFQLESDIPATLSMNGRSLSPLGSRLQSRFKSQTAK
jgi:carbon storage regulator